MGSSITRGILHNYIRKMLMVYSRNCRCGSNNEVEALALLWGLRLVIKCGINRMMVKGDWMLIIKVAKGDSQSSWLIKVIIEENCKSMEEY